jgi:predicted amidophosphoribosyltransferase
LSRETGIRLRSRILIRLPATDRVTKKLKRRDRAEFARRVYRAACRVPGERVLLVDDVMTTGSSAEVCAAILRQAGAGEVRFAAWARTLPGRIP